MDSSKNYLVNSWEHAFCLIPARTFGPGLVAGFVYEQFITVKK